MSIQLFLQFSQCLIGSSSSTLGLFHLQTVAKNAGEVQALLVRAGVDLGAVCFGVGMNGLDFAVVMKGRVFSESDSSRLLVPQALDQVIEGTLHQIQPHDLIRPGGEVSGLVFRTERQSGGRNIEFGGHGW